MNDRGGVMVFSNGTSFLLPFLRRFSFYLRAHLLPFLPSFLFLNSSRRAYPVYESWRGSKGNHRLSLGCMNEGRKAQRMTKPRLARMAKTESAKAAFVMSNGRVVRAGIPAMP